MVSGGAFGSQIPLMRLSRASNPKIAITPPEILLIQNSQAGVNLRRRRLRLPVRKHHQSVEPEKTPRTTSAAERKLWVVAPTPRPAKTAAKERIVSGFVRVRRKVEA